MKKFFVLGLLFLAGIGFASAQTTASKDIPVSATVDKHVYIVSATDLAFTSSLDGAAAATVSGTAYIRSNHNSWTFKVYADKGILTEYVGSAYVVSGVTIPYTFTFNSAGATAEKMVGITVPTTAATAASTATFTTRTTGGTTGQAFLYSVTVPAMGTTTDWAAATYHDVLHVTVTAN